MHQRKDVLKDVKKTCPVCKLSFKTLFKFKEHLLKHASKVGHQSVKCHVNNCGNVFENSLLYEHILFDHFPEQYKLKCDQCDFKTTTSSKLKNHLMMHFDERPFQCKQCNKSFRKKSQLTEHTNSIHSVEKSNSNNQYSCQTCDKTFESKASLQTHEKTVHKKTESLCSVCGLYQKKCSCNKSEFEERIPCPVCSKKIVARNMSSHLHYHRQSSLRPYICQECSQTFTHASSLKRHALLHTVKAVQMFQMCQRVFPKDCL